MINSEENIKIVNKYFVKQCTRNNVPLTARHLISIFETGKVDLDKPLVIEIDGSYYPIEDTYIIDKDKKDEEPDEMNGCLVIDMDVC